MCALPLFLDHHLINILTCYCLERLRRKNLLADLLLPLLKGWVAPRSNSLARLVGRVPRLLEADLGITPDCELLLDLADPVPETPQLAASRRDLDIEAALVSDLVRLVFRSEERRVGKECVSTSRSRGSPET